MNEQQPVSTDSGDWEESASQPLLDSPRSVTHPPPAPVQPERPAEPAAAVAAAPPAEDDEDDAAIQRKYRGKSAYGRIKELSGEKRVWKSERETLTAETARLKAENDALRRAPQPQAVAPQRVNDLPPREAAGNRPATATSDPRPDPRAMGEDGKTLKYADGVYDPDYIHDLARWGAREEHREITKRTKEETDERTRGESWSKHVSAARAKFPDFDAVAFAPTRIQSGSPIDVFIMEDETGADVLYHLQKNPAELSALLGLSALGQLKALSLLSQRLSSPTPSRLAGGNTGAPPAPALSMVPRPPTPVRTGPVSAATGVPDADSDDLDAHMKHYYPKGRLKNSRAG